MLALVFGGIWAARKLDFNSEDGIAAVFCGSKKSLAYGIPMARIFFIGNSALGLICSLVACRCAVRRGGRANFRQSGRQFLLARFFSFGRIMLNHRIHFRAKQHYRGRQEKIE